MKLPDAQNIETAAPGAGPQATQVASIAPVGGAITRIGEALVERADRRAAYQLSRAKTDFLRRKLQLENKFDGDRDWKTLPKRYEDGLREHLNSSAKMIDNEAARSAFINKLDLSVMQGVEAQKEFAFGIERDEAIANLNEDLIGLEEAGLVGDHEQAISTASDYLAGMVEAGYMDAAKAGATERAWKDRFAANKINLMPARQRLEALEQPFGQNLPMAMRETIRKDAEAELVEEEAIEFVDGLMDLSPSQARTQLRGIQDKELRLEAEQRYKREWAFQKQVEQDADDQLFDQYAMPVVMGEMKVDEIPRSILEGMGPQMVRQLQSWEVGEGKTETYPEFYFEFNEAMSGGDVRGARQLVRDYYEVGQISRADLEQYLRLSTEDEAGEIPAAKSIFSTQQQINRAATQAGLEDKEDIGTLMGSMNEWEMQFQEREQREPTDRERQEESGRAGR